MKNLVRPALVLGIAGVLALGSITASQARVRPYVWGGSGFRPWVAGAAGFTAGAAIGAAAANAAAYGADASYGSYDPAYADTSDPNSVHSFGYNSYAYAPGYRTDRGGYGYGYDASTQSVPRHYDPGYGYNSNTLAPWQDRKLQGSDY